MTATQDTMIRLINAHAYHPVSHRFGWHLKGRTIEERYAEVQQRLNQQKAASAASKAWWKAYYAAQKAA